MKRCPGCGREYDNSMMFCLDDGTELLYGPANVDEPATAILSVPRGDILSEPGAIATGFFPSESPTKVIGTEAQPQEKFRTQSKRQSHSAHLTAEPQESITGSPGKNRTRNI